MCPLFTFLANSPKYLLISVRFLPFVPIYCSDNIHTYYIEHFAIWNSNENNIFRSFVFAAFIDNNENFRNDVLFVTSFAMLTLFIHFNKLRAFRFFITVRARSTVWALENYTDVIIIFTIWLSRSHIYWHLLFSAQNNFVFIFIETFPFVLSWTWSFTIFSLFIHMCVAHIRTKFVMKQIENQSKWKSIAHVWILMRYALYFLFWICYMRLMNSNESEIAFFLFMIWWRIKDFIRFGEWQLSKTKKQ